jgi:hypothetical protein
MRDRSGPPVWCCCLAPCWSSARVVGSGVDRRQRRGTWRCRAAKPLWCCWRGWGCTVCWSRGDGRAALQLPNLEGFTDLIGGIGLVGAGLLVVLNR